MPTTATLDYTSSPTRTLAVTLNYGDGSKSPIFGRDLRSQPVTDLHSANPNTAVNGADLALSFVLTVPHGGAIQTVNLQSFIDAAQRAAQSFVRVKSVEFWLLGSNDAPPNAPVAGNACSGVTISPGATSGNNLFLGGTAPDVVLGNGDSVVWRTGTSGGKTVDPTHKNLDISCTDAAVDGLLFIQIIGGST